MIWELALWNITYLSALGKPAVKKYLDPVYWLCAAALGIES